MNTTAVLVACCAPAAAPLTHFRGKKNGCDGQKALFKVNTGSTKEFQGELAVMESDLYGERPVSRALSQRVFLDMGVNYKSILEQPEEWTPNEVMVATPNTPPEHVGKSFWSVYGTDLPIELKFMTLSADVRASKKETLMWKRGKAHLTQDAYAEGLEQAKNRIRDHNTVDNHVKEELVKRKHEENEQKPEAVQKRQRTNAVLNEKLPPKPTEAQIQAAAAAALQEEAIAQGPPAGRTRASQTRRRGG